MAKVTFKGMAKYGDALKQLELSFAGNNDILERAAKAGADPVADEIRNRLANLPEAKFQRLPEGGKFMGISSHQKEDLLEGFGVTPPGRDKTGFVHVKVGFEGYGSFPTKSYPNGVPNALIARAAESGSSVRQKTPFVRPAVRATTKKAIEEMDKSLERDLKQII